MTQPMAPTTSGHGSDMFAFAAMESALVRTAATCTVGTKVSIDILVAAPNIASAGPPTPAVTLLKPETIPARIAPRVPRRHASAVSAARGGRPPSSTPRRGSRAGRCPACRR